MFHLLASDSTARYHSAHTKLTEFAVRGYRQLLEERRSAEVFAPPITYKFANANRSELDGKDKFGNTSLHYASQRGSKDIVKFLISNKANINTKNKGGETPLDIAANKETDDILSNHNGTYGTFIGAVTAGDLNAIMMFLNAGVDVNQKIQHGWTALHETAIFGHTGAAKLLISKGANINAWDGYETPLDASDKESDYAKFLRKHGGMIGKELKTQKI